MAVAKLEDSLISKASSKAVSMPRRPAFGTQGDAITLWANYFNLTLTCKKTFMKYILEAERVDPKKKEGDKPANNKVRVPSGGKLHSIIKTVLEQVSKPPPPETGSKKSTAKPILYATDFKTKVIALEPLHLPEDNIVTVPYTDEGMDDLYKVKFHASTVDIPRLLTALKTMADPSGGDPNDVVNLNDPNRFRELTDALNVIMGYTAQCSAKVLARGSNRYFPTGGDQDGKLQSEEKILSHDSRLVRGFSMNARVATGRVLTNVNVAHMVFRYQGEVTALMDKVKDLRALDESLKGLRVECVILSDDKDPKKTRRIQRVLSGLAHRDDGSAPEKRPIVPDMGGTAQAVQFYLKSPAPEGLKSDSYCSVANYYKKKYGYDVNKKYPVVNVGTKKRPVYMPAEFLRALPGQPLKRSINQDETRQMIEFSCRNPYDNAMSIWKAGRHALGLDDTRLRDFGLEVGQHLVTVQGRILSSPTITYSDKACIQTKEGQWNMAGSVKVVKPGKTLDRWFWITIDYATAGGHNRFNDIDQAMARWINFMKGQGIPISQRSLTLADERRRITLNGNDHIADTIRPVFKEMQAFNPQMVFVVLPGKKTDSAIYNVIKRLGDIEFGYHTQHILQSTLLSHKNDQSFANLGLKVNLKLGGTNHHLREEIPILKMPTMVVGYDVTHPNDAPVQKMDLPSMVGMVSSIDSDLGQWPATCWAQEGCVEMLHPETLEKRFGERLKLWYKHQKRLPSNIIIFRDGVSETQFSQVLSEELPRIRKACQSQYPANNQPKISLIVSVKRHQTRFYPTTQGQTCGKPGNVRNGTVVDRGLTQANTWDFFLTAHKGIQGTSRSAHYTVLYDEVFKGRDNPVHQLERLTYQMCFLFGRATKAVSICPPAYYADIVCTRARVYLSELFESAKAPHGQAAAEKKPEARIVNTEIHGNLKDSMFYI
ncbi:ribonuclease H-like domain-containing protein [Xylaria nigripes]|nr:ribonuclease H-like domain-containing protein [Xylaria nigripes]